jgi:cob(I)alamin adenosyltransferase
MSRKRDEPVRLTRIYTRGGDQGETSLGDGTRVSKRDPRVDAYGEVDELNSLLGWAAAVEGSPKLLQRIQNELFDLGADLATPDQDGRERLRVTQEQVDRLERECDAANGASPLVVVYLNRLSDLLFILARAANAGAQETLWQPGASGA